MLTWTWLWDKSQSKKREKQGGREGGRVTGSERKWWASQGQAICWVCARLIEVMREIKRCRREGGRDMQLMRIWCRGIKTKSSSRTREQHTGREVIPCNRCIMHRHQLSKEDMGRECNVLQAWKSLNPLKGNEKTIICGFDVTKLDNIWTEGIFRSPCRDNTCMPLWKQANDSVLVRPGKLILF